MVTPDDEEMIASLAMLGTDDTGPGQDLAGFRSRLRRLREDPSEAARIEALAVEADQDHDEALIKRSSLDEGRHIGRLADQAGERARTGGMRVAVAEDSGLFRSSLVLLLRSLGADVTASAASGTELLAAIRESPPDAVILDIRMPPSFTDEGIRAALEIRDLHPGVGILVLSTYAEASYANQLLETVRTGVGYLLKDNVTDAGALMESLERVVTGETVLDPVIVRRLLGRKRKPGVTDALNERELSVLRHMAEGRSNLGIAKELFLSPLAVETHVTSVFTKLGLAPSDTENNRVRAVLAFLHAAGPQP